MWKCCCAHAVVIVIVIIYRLKEISDCVESGFRVQNMDDMEENISRKLLH